MSQSKFAILQSGFLSFDNGDLTKKNPVDESDILRNVKLGKPVQEPSNPFFYNEPMESVFETFSNNHRAMVDYNYREQFLQTVKRAFCTQSALGWFRLQLESPYLTKLHRKFILDTFKFLSEGKRDIQIENWMSLITMETMTAADKEIDIRPERYFNIPSHNPNVVDAVDEESVYIADSTKLPIKFSTLVRLWTSRPEGFKDLLYFSRIVFGREILTQNPTK